MFTNKKGLTDYPNSWVNTSNGNPSPIDNGRKSISEYIKKALKAKPEQDLILNTQGT